MHRLANESNKKEEIYENQAEKLAGLTFLLARACEEKESYFTSLYDLTNAEFRCMRFLKDNCYLSVKQLAKEMHLTPGRVTQIITSLEKKKYLTREIDPNDRRNIRVCLTEVALPYIQNVTQKHVAIHAELLANIQEEVREPVLMAMEKLLDSLTNWAKNKED